MVVFLFSFLSFLFKSSSSEDVEGDFLNQLLFIIVPAAAIPVILAVTSKTSFHLDALDANNMIITIAIPSKYIDLKKK